jgi:ATP-dependent DNA ligase
VIDRIPIRVRPMLALLVPKPFNRSGWVFEEKYDGIRILAYKEGAKVTLLSRTTSIGLPHLRTSPPRWLKSEIEP